jgi:cell wall-associated NlpC family hydrolase
MKRRSFLALAGTVTAITLYEKGAPASASGKPSPKPAASGKPTAPGHAAVIAIKYALAQRGHPYVWGGDGPGFDCSGLCYMAYQSAGVSIPRTSQDQWAQLTHIRKSQLQPGDLIFYAGSDGTVTSPGHVVMYIGHGNVIQAFATGYPVMITPLKKVDAGDLTGYARPVAA